MDDLELWTEKYRPKDLEDYVFKDEDLRKAVDSWLQKGCITAHLLLSGIQGSGKTSLALLLFRLLNVDSGDILVINASEERGIDTVREKILNFSSSWPIGDYKYILLDEADALTPDAQRSLRNVMEKFSKVVRFILTCNYPQKIIPALHSRCQSYHFDALDRENYLIRCGEILARENIEFDIETLEDYVNVTYPDMRKCINLLQQNSTSGRLLTAKEAKGTADYLLKMTDLFKRGKITEARKLVASQARPEEYEEIYRFLYENLHFWGETEEQHDQAIVIINEGLKGHTLVADPEINLAATFSQLNKIRKGI